MIPASVNPDIYGFEEAYLNLIAAAYLLQLLALGGAASLYMPITQ